MDNRNGTRCATMEAEQTRSNALTKKEFFLAGWNGCAESKKKNEQ